MEDLFALLADQPLPPSSGYTPSEHELAQCQKALKDGATHLLRRELQRWVYHDLMPCLVKYGCYPPPSTAQRRGGLPI